MRLFMWRSQQGAFVIASCVGQLRRGVLCGSGPIGAANKSLENSRMVEASTGFLIPWGCLNELRVEDEATIKVVKEE
ncbi:hypothetical protein VNO80_16195 [Phaseolus coccineus]|uniref:Uncharacterized protein n=1 Tax=Phaseolus coccineus TaxID=3886 RepID=A0AAN9QZW0_PHACN